LGRRREGSRGAKNRKWKVEQVSSRADSAGCTAGRSRLSTDYCGGKVREKSRGKK